MANITGRKKPGFLTRDPLVDKVFYIATWIIMAFIFVIFFYPIWYVIIASFSNGSALVSGKVVMWPVGFNLEGYTAVFKNSKIVTSFLNSVIYTVSGTFISLACTFMAAYPLARHGLPGGKIIMLLFTFTMFFSGGMIPDYLLVMNLGMLNTRWAMIIPGAIGVYNMIIARTFIMNSIPKELYEATQIDGCSDTRYFFQFVLPLSTAVIAVLGLYSAVGNWNSYFSAFLYLSDTALYPLQIILRQILVQNQIDPNMTLAAQFDSVQNAAARENLAQLLKYSLIIISTLPVMTLYPIAQKYFAKGVMIGAIKG
jgi:multiple sugar transport system permease protein/putative aldouronate transport system permease protein